MTGINGGTQNLTGTLSFHFLVTKKGGTIYGNYSGGSEIVIKINGAEAAMDLINNNISIKIPVYSPPTPHNGSKPQVSILSTSRGTHISPNDLSLDYIGGVNISFQISYTLVGTSISVPLQVTLVKEANETYVVITLTNPSNQELKFDGDWAYKSGP
jgi:hypothetical protein